MENRAQKYIRAGFKVFRAGGRAKPRAPDHTDSRDAHSDLALAATIPDDRCGVFPNGRLLVDVGHPPQGAASGGRLDEQEVRSGAPMGVDAHGDGHYLYAMPDAPWVALVTQKAGLLGSPIDIRCSAGYFRAKEDPPETIPPCPSGLLAAVKEWAETKGPKSTGRTEWPEPTKTPDEIRGLLFQQDAGMGRGRMAFPPVVGPCAVRGGRIRSGLGLVPERGPRAGVHGAAHTGRLSTSTGTHSTSQITRLRSAWRS